MKKPRTIVRGFVTPAGFKPTTACLEGRSSIQLSYRVRYPFPGQTGVGNGCKAKKKGVKGQIPLFPEGNLLNFC